MTRVRVDVPADPLRPNPIGRGDRRRDTGNVTRTRVRRAAAQGVCLLAACLPALGGCLRTTVIRDGWADFAADAAANGGQVTLGRDPAAAQEARRGGRAGARPHRLRLAAFEGPERLPDGHEASVLARQGGRLQEITLVDADGVAVLYGGRFADAKDPAAVAARKRLRRVRGPEGSRFAGERPFRDARLVALEGAAGAGGGGGGVAPSDPLDLRGHPGLYTLQVGFFDDAAKPDRRTAAERWANQLRREEQVEAFYHHGPNRSLVTVGLFDRRQFVQEGQVEGYPPEARELRERFPHNLGNGSTLLERRRGGGEPTPQRSLLVRTPG